MLTFSKYMFNTVQVDALAGIGKYLESYEGYGISYEDVHDAINEHDISSAKGKFYPTSHTRKMRRDRSFLKQVLTYWTSMCLLPLCDGTEQTSFPGKQVRLVSIRIGCLEDFK